MHFLCHSSRKMMSLLLLIKPPVIALSQIPAPAGPRTDLAGHAHSAQSNPIRGLSRDLTGRAPGFERAPYGHTRDSPWSPLQISMGCTGTNQNWCGPKQGKPWACPYGACVGLKRGCPCPDRPRTNSVRDQTRNVIWDCSGEAITIRTCAINRQWGLMEHCKLFWLIDVTRVLIEH